MPSLYATPLDLELLGAPAAALSRVRTAETYQLAAQSSVADNSLRGRYTLPLIAQVGSVLSFPATGSTATASVTVALTEGASVVPLQAYGIIVQVLTSGALGVATARYSTDGGVTYGASFTTSATPIDLPFGVTLTFGAGTYYVGDAYKCSVSYNSVTTYVVSLTVYSLLRTRGVSPDGNAYDPIRDAYKEALQGLKDIRDLRSDPGLSDSSGGTGSEVFIEDPALAEDLPLEQDRRWQGTVGRVGVTGNPRSWGVW